jgi:hypothetical protein
MWHYNTFVTPQVFQFIGPSNDGRRHGRGTYLFCSPSHNSHNSDLLQTIAVSLRLVPDRQRGWLGDTDQISLKNGQEDQANKTTSSYNFKG